MRVDRYISTLFINLTMKKYIYLITILFCTSIVCYSQNYYSKVFNFLNGNEGGSFVDLKADTVFIHAHGVCDPGTSDSRGCYYLLSLIGENKKTYMLDNRFSTASAKSGVIDGDTIYSFGMDYRNHPDAHYLKVIKSNLNTDSLGQFTYLLNPNTHTEAQSIMVKDEFIYLNGNIGEWDIDRNPYVLKFDKSGKMLHDERFEEYLYPKDENLSIILVETTDGNLALLSYYRAHHTYNLWVCKFDDDFNRIWKKDLPVFGSDNINNPWSYMVPTSDNGLVISKEIYLLDSMMVYPYTKYEGLEDWAQTLTKLDGDGEIVWSDTMFHKILEGLPIGPLQGIRKLSTCRNGDILCIGYYFCPEICNTSYYAWLARYSKDGILKWKHLYSNQDYAPKGFGTAFSDAKEAENGDILCTGKIEDANGEWNNSRCTWLVRLDSMGCYTPGCLTGDTLTEVFTTATEEIMINISGKIAVYPNPVQDVINISVPEGFTVEDAEFYDIFGRLVKKVSWGSMEIDIKSFPTGIYIVIVKSADKKRLITKFIKN
jgi:hypothetical protein